MHPELILCASQEENTIPYQFHSTDVAVYSLEEAMYHIYHNWKQSAEDLLSDEFASWVGEHLRLSFIASQIRELVAMQNFSERILRFLTVIDYFDDQELSRLRTELAGWEKRLEWERLKERGDILMRKSEPSKALMLYRQALCFDQNAALLNNAAIALLQLEVYDEAMSLLSRALDLSPDNPDLLMHYAEAAIYARNLEKALRALKRAEELFGKDPQNDSAIQFLYGELNVEAGNTRYAVDYFHKAIALSPEPHYLYRLSDLYTKQRQYDKALDTLDQIQPKDTLYLIKQAEVLAAGNNLPAAIKSIERALATDNKNVELWTRLAGYYRLDYDPMHAASAISQALRIDPEHERANLENAKIKKALGKTRDYQAILHNVLSGFKRRYREMFNE